MKKEDPSETRDSERYENPRIEVEWRVVDGGRYHKSKLVNFSNGGLAVCADSELEPDQKLAFRVKLPGGVAYVMGKVRHSFESESLGPVTGVSIDFFDAREKDRFARRVDELKYPRRDYKTHQF